MTGLEGEAGGMIQVVMIPRSVQMIQEIDTLSEEVVSREEVQMSF